MTEEADDMRQQLIRIQRLFDLRPDKWPLLKAQTLPELDVYGNDGLRNTIYGPAWWCPN